MNVKRYDFVQPDNWAGHPYPDGAYMELSDDGEYVMFDDYALVVAELDALKEKIDSMINA